MKNNKKTEEWYSLLTKVENLESKIKENHYKLYNCYQNSDLDKYKTIYDETYMLKTECTRIKAKLHLIEKHAYYAADRMVV